MASLRLDPRTGFWTVRFYWNGTQHQRTCRTKEKAAAARTLQSVEEMVGLLERRLVKMPEKLTPTLQVEWILSGGKLDKKASLNGSVNGSVAVKEAAKSDRLGDICAEYLVDQKKCHEGNPSPSSRD